MTIDETIRDFETKQMLAIVNENRRCEALDVAIETMRKYQKIEQIISDWNKTGGSTPEWRILEDIEEVL